jgi:hypothetical protein
LKRTRTEIAIEFEEMIQIVDQGGGVSRSWCTACDGLVTMVTPQQAAAIARVSVRVINQRVEAGVVHFLETPAGALLVCLRSLG